MFKFIHAADIHLDSPLRGLSQYDGAPAAEIRGATRRALQNLVHVALDEGVDFVLIAGDVYDGDWKDYNTGLYFARQMARLKAASIPVFLIAGNHDARSVMTRTLQLPDNVHVFPTGRPGTVLLEKLGVAIHGQGFATKSVTKDLSAKYPEAVSRVYNIGLLHTSLTGYEGHDNYAPCTVAGLSKHRYDYWALGHIHQQECINAEDPAIWYSGNIQGRHIRESGPKGCLVISVADSGTHEVRFQSLDVFRWAVLLVDVADCEDRRACVEKFSEALGTQLDRVGDRSLALRVEFQGNSNAHGALVSDAVQLQYEIRNAANIYGGDQVWVEKVKVRTRPALKLLGDTIDDGPLAMLAEVVKDLQEDEGGEDALVDLLESLQNKLPPEVRDGEDGLNLSDPKVLRDLLGEAEPIIRMIWRDVEGTS